MSCPINSIFFNAVKNNDADLVWELVKCKEINVNDREPFNPDCWKAIHYAIANGNGEICAALLQYVDDINYMDATCETLLHKAV